MTSFRAEYRSDLTPQPADWAVVVAGKQVLVDTHVAQPLIHQDGALPMETFCLRLHLGYWRDAACFLYVWPDTSAVEIDSSRYQFGKLRGQLGVIDEDAFFFAGRGLQLAHWFRRHRFCGQCGSATSLHDTELAFVCTSCDEYFYPVISPCVMGLVVKGDTCLLAHNTRFPDGFYSVVAGFIEAGETAEAAVLREVLEETGVVARDPVYVTSQSWPFPSQLMLGYMLAFDEGEIRVDGKEIDHAQWFSPETLPLRPPAESLSGKLIELFQNGYRAG